MVRPVAVAAASAGRAVGVGLDAVGAGGAVGGESRGGPGEAGQRAIDASPAAAVAARRAVVVRMQAPPRRSERSPGSSGRPKVPRRTCFGRGCDVKNPRSPETCPALENTAVRELAFRGSPEISPGLTRSRTVVRVCQHETLGRTALGSSGPASLRNLLQKYASRFAGSGQRSDPQVFALQQPAENGETVIPTRIAITCVAPVTTISSEARAPSRIARIGGPRSHSGRRVPSVVQLRSAGARRVRRRAAARPPSGSPSVCPTCCGGMLLWGTWIANRPAL